VVAVVGPNADLVRDQPGTVVLVAAVALALNLAGYALGWACRAVLADRADRTALLFTVSKKEFSIAALVVVASGLPAEVALPAVVYAVVQMLTSPLVARTLARRALARARVDDIDRKGLPTIAAELRERSERLRTGADDDWEHSKRIVRALPTPLLRPLVWLTGWLTSSLGIGAKPLGLERQPFGSAIVTSVGMLGLDEAWVPPTPFARVPLYVLIGAVRDRAVVVDGAVVVRPMLTVTATIDHRYIDGFQAATLARVFRRVFEDPWSLDAPDGAPARVG
jgi:hypothetical protein